jgi:hypothetical protein
MSKKTLRRLGAAALIGIAACSTPDEAPVAPPAAALTPLTPVAIIQQSAAPPPAVLIEMPTTTAMVAEPIAPGPARPKPRGRRRIQHAPVRAPQPPMPWRPHIYPI